MQYAKFVKPAFDDFVLPSKKYADVIIPRGGDNHVAIDLIVQHIRTKLGQHNLCKIYPNVYVIQSTFQVYVWLIVLWRFYTFGISLENDLVGSMEKRKFWGRCLDLSVYAQSIPVYLISGD
jgi:hypothetical protein